MKTKLLHFFSMCLFLFLGITGYGQCQNINGDFTDFTGVNFPGTSSTNFWINNNLTNWNVSHGTPTYNSNSSEMWMWSANGEGEGIYTGYNFVAGTTYCVTYDILNSTTSHNNSRFIAALTNGLLASNGTNPSIPNPGPGPSQQISNLTWNYSGNVISVTETFVANDNYSQLWLYPFLSENIFLQSLQAACTIDNVCIQVVSPVVATQPVVNVCTTDASFYIGTANGPTTQTLPVNNVYWTNDFFTPIDGYIPGNTSANGSFTVLPSGITTNTFGNGASSVTLYSFDPSLAGPGSHIVEYTYIDPCSGQVSAAQMEIIVKAPPVVSFLDLTIDLCDVSGPVAINPLTNGMNCTVSGAFVSSNMFNALAAGVGTHTVQITCESALGCSTTITGTITVEQNDGWHNTTSNAVALSDAGDTGNDIFTDKEGYVYSTGSFFKETTFRDHFGNGINLVTTTPKEEKFYAVCYNSCGELQWVIYDDYQASDHNSSGFGVSKNEDELFVGVNYTPKAIFKTVYPNGTSFTFGSNANGVSSAIGNVCLLAVDGPNTNTFGQVNAVDNALTNRKGKALYTDSSGDKEIYVCGSADLNNNFIPEIFFAKAKYSQNAIFSLMWSRESLDESRFHVANDIVLNPANGLLLITGGYSKKLSLLNNQNTPVGFSTSAIQDAFFTTVNLDGYVSGFGLRKFGVNTSQIAEGTTITCNDQYFYIGGNYKGTTASPFSFGLASAASSNNSSYINGFVFSYRWPSGIAKFENIWNITSPVNITGIDAFDTNVILVGAYKNGNVETSLGAIGTNPTNNNQFFVGNIDIANGNWYIPELVNSSLNLNNGNHIPSRISVGENGFAYITGKYTGDLSYLFGSPSSGNLSATGSNSFVSNAFFIRNELITSQLRSTENNDEKLTQNSNIYDESLDITDKSNEISATAFPNPTRDILTVKVDNYVNEEELDIKVFNVLGKLMYASKSLDSQIQINTSGFADGIYFLRINLKNQTETLRIIKEK